MDYPLKKLEYDGSVMIRDYAVKDAVTKNENVLPLPRPPFAPLKSALP